MKLRISGLLLLLVISHAGFAQLMTFGFTKNCMDFERPTVTDELKKKHFLIVEDAVKKADQDLLVGAAYYSNETDRTPGIGEIAVLSQIAKGSKKITEIAFKSGTKNDFSKNYNDVYNQFVQFFKVGETFKSKKFGTDVLVYLRDKRYYYFFKNNSVPTIVVSNYDIRALYFQ